MLSAPPAGGNESAQARGFGIRILECLRVYSIKLNWRNEVEGIEGILILPAAFVGFALGSAFGQGLAGGVGATAAICAIVGAIVVGGLVGWGLMKLSQY
jgi:hypothetical protein